MAKGSKATAAEKALADFEASFLKDMGVSLDRSGEITPYEVISTGSIELDYKLRVGGWVEGRIMEIHGPEHSGKTTLCMIAARNAQRKHPGKMVGWVDMEQTFDKEWARKNGVDLRRLWLFTPKSAEDTADATKRLVRSGLCSLVVLDSVGGMITRMQMEKEADEATVADVPKVVTRMVLGCSPMANENGTGVIVVNQLRSRIARFGPDTTTPGGWALKHVTTIKLAIRRGSENPRTVRVEGELIPVSYQVAVKIEKNKTAPYGATALFWMTNQATEKWGPVGIDQIEEAFSFGKRLGFITGSTWKEIDGEKFQGDDKVKDYLRENPELVERIREAAIASVAGDLQTDDSEPPIDAMVDPETGEVLADFSNSMGALSFEEPPVGAQ